MMVSRSTLVVVMGRSSCGHAFRCGEYRRARVPPRGGASRHTCARWRGVVMLSASKAVWQAFLASVVMLCPLLRIRRAGVSLTDPAVKCAPKVAILGHSTPAARSRAGACLQSGPCTMGHWGHFGTRYSWCAEWSCRCRSLAAGTMVGRAGATAKGAGVTQERSRCVTVRLWLVLL